MAKNEPDTAMQDDPKTYIAPQSTQTKKSFCYDFRSELEQFDNTKKTLPFRGSAP